MFCVAISSGYRGPFVYTEKHVRVAVLLYITDERDFAVASLGFIVTSEPSFSNVLGWFCRAVGGIPHRTLASRRLDSDLRYEQHMIVARRCRTLCDPPNHYFGPPVGDCPDDKQTRRMCKFSPTKCCLA